MKKSSASFHLDLPPSQPPCCCTATLRLAREAITTTISLGYPATLAYPATLEIDYPARELNRLTTFLRPLVALPVLILLGPLSGRTIGIGATSALLTLCQASSAGGFPVSAYAVLLTTDQYPPFSLAE